MAFTYATVCSGVEGATLALEAAPPTRGAWKPVFFSEIAPFPSAVLAHHYPDVPNLGDMQKITFKNGVVSNGSVDVCLHEQLTLLAGGTPCQDFSNNGYRLGGGKDQAQEAAYVGTSCDWLKSYNQKRCFGKMCRGAFQPTAEKTFLDSLPRLQNSGIAWDGEYWTANTPEWTAGLTQSHNGGGVCGLLGFLEEPRKTLKKYCLSPRACLGILRRAERRKKTLPAPLKAALEGIATGKVKLERCIQQNTHPACLGLAVILGGQKS